jgi:hypothetical protein
VAQEDLLYDTEMLRTLVRHDRLDVAGSGLCSCAGVYRRDRIGGTIKEGDAGPVA